MVASCWLFLNNLYYDARIHEHQVPLTALLREVPFLCTDQQAFLCPDALKQINLTAHIRVSDF
jgi:hypothetical protein